MEYGSMSIQRLQSGRWLNWGIRFFLTAALTASQTAGGYAPFALGCIAAAGPGADGAAALLGGVTGALLFLDFQQVLALAAVGILILTAATAFRDTAFLQKPWVLPVLAAGMVLAVGGIYVLQSLDPLSHAAPCAAASALTGVSALFFTRLFQPEEDRLAPEGLLFLGAALTLALGDLTILNVSVGRVLLCALLAYTAYDQGPMTGVTAGLGLGLITDLSAGTSGPFTAAYGVAGLCAAKCRRRSMAALAFFSGAAAAMLTSRHHYAVPARRLAFPGNGADQVIGLPPLHFIAGDVQGIQHLFQHRHLHPQFLRHGLPGGLVRLVRLVTEGRGVEVEGDAQGIRPFFLLQAQQRGEKAEHGVGVQPFPVSQGADAVIGPVDDGVAVNDHALHGKTSGVF